MSSCRSLAFVALLAGTDAYAPVAALLAPARHAGAASRPALPLRAQPTCPGARHAFPAVAMAETLTKETVQRSAVKAVGWRFTAGIVTAITSLFFTGSLAMAAKIVGWDLLTKSFTMFLGERLWNKSEYGKSGGADNAKRSLIKALAWRAFACTNTLVGAMVLTGGKGGIAGKIAGSDTVVKTALYYVYERAWSRVDWGREAIVMVDEAKPEK